MKRTPLYDIHAAAGATFTPFAGFEMPVHYGSIKDEHMAVRQSVGLFDVSHMSNVWLEGDDAISSIIPKPIHDLEEGRGRYSTVLNSDGTILDDIFLFRLDGRIFSVPNAGMNEAVAARFQAAGAKAKDVSQDWAILALQGPQARAVLAAASSDEAPKFHRITRMTIAGAPCLVSGTGYTGEKGVEIYAPADKASGVWLALMQAGATASIRPIGLGARDTLRLEKGYCLAGHEFAGGRTPIEAGLGFIVDPNHAFPGSDSIHAEGPRLWGVLLDRGIPREGYLVKRGSQHIGTVTSGTMSPTLGKGIGLAFLEGANEGDEVEVEVRGRAMPATVTKPPFV